MTTKQWYHFILELEVTMFESTEGQYEPLPLPKHQLGRSVASEQYDMIRMRSDFFYL